MNKIVVTGAAGFIGSAFIKKCLKNNVFVYAIDIADHPEEHLPVNDKRLKYFRLDIFNTENIKTELEQFHPDTFYHFAWKGSSGPLRSDYECQVKNALNVVELLKVAKEIGCKRFVCAGTIMEYESYDAIYTQGTAPHTGYIYGIGKQLAHLLCKPIANELGIDLIWGMVTNAYGVGELSPRLINTTILKCINKEPLKFTSATQIYDFIYIDDVAEGFYLLGEKGKKNKHYLIGSGEAKPLKWFLTTLINICDKNAKPQFGDIEFTGTDLPLETFSIDEIKKDCGFFPKISFEEGIKRSYEWLKGKEK